MKTELGKVVALEALDRFEPVLRRFFRGFGYDDSVGYDFRKIGWDRGGSFNPALIPEYAGRLLLLADDPTKYEVTTDGGWPRCGWRRAISVSLESDPPTFTTEGMFGPETHSWYMLSDMRVCVDREGMTVQSEGEQR